MSPLAKLLQIRPASERPSADWRSAAGTVWKRFVELLRSARVQRKVRRLEIVERVALGSKQSVLLLRVDQKEFVVGCCGESVVLLVAPPAEQPKIRVTRQQRVKPPALQPAVVAPPQVVEAAQQTLQVETAKKPRARKVSPQIELPLKARVPSKARLLKSFARSK
jgi:flagellar biogenesis protein FliO